MDAEANVAKQHVEKCNIHFHTEMMLIEITEEQKAFSCGKHKSTFASRNDYKDNTNNK